MKAAMAIVVNEEQRAALESMVRSQTIDVRAASPVSGTHRLRLRRQTHDLRCVDTRLTAAARHPGATMLGTIDVRCVYLAALWLIKFYRLTLPLRDFFQYQILALQTMISADREMLVTPHLHIHISREIRLHFRSP